jgi:spore coat protein U-like protein
MNTVGKSLALLMLLAGVEAQALDCTFSTTGVAFGVYDPVATAATTATGNLTVRCTYTGGGASRANYTAALSTGSSGTYAQRQMRAGGAVLSYNLFDGASYTRIWGNGTAGTGVIAGSLLVNPGSNRVSEAFHPIYGNIPAQQSAAIGSYTDTILVTLTF